MVLQAIFLSEREGGNTVAGNATKNSRKKIAIYVK